jgi:hypothetical protein
MNFDDMRAEVFRQKPHLQDVVSASGHLTSTAYYAQVFPNLSLSSPDILDALEKETALILGSDTGEKARMSLERTQWTNTADHQGLLCHPYFYATALARSNKAVRDGGGVTRTQTLGGN